MIYRTSMRRTIKLEGEISTSDKKQNESLHAKRLKCNCCPRRKEAQDAIAGVENRLEKWRSQQMAELEDKQNALVADKVKKEENKHQLEMELQRKQKTLQTEYNRQVKQETQTLKSLPTIFRRR